MQLGMALSSLPFAHAFIFFLCALWLFLIYPSGSTTPRVVPDRAGTASDGATPYVQVFYHYAVLDISKSLSFDEVQKAYKKAAMNCHPDRRIGDPGASAEFMLFSHARDVIADKYKRKIVDMTLESDITSIGISPAPECRVPSAVLVGGGPPGRPSGIADKIVARGPPHTPVTGGPRVRVVDVETPSGTHFSTTEKATPVDGETDAHKRKRKADNSRVKSRDKAGAKGIDSRAAHASNEAERLNAVSDAERSAARKAKASNEAERLNAMSDAKRSAARAAKSVTDAARSAAMSDGSSSLLLPSSFPFKLLSLSLSLSHLFHLLESHKI